LVAVRNQPRIKLSQEVSKITIPGRKKCFRLYGKNGKAILDLMTMDSEPDPEPGQSILCMHPFEVLAGPHSCLEPFLNIQITGVKACPRGADTGGEAATLLLE